MLNSEIYGINLNMVNAGTVATAAAATLATTAATSAVIEGGFTTALASGAGKALSLVDSAGVAKAAVPLLVNQACTIVNCVDASGAMKNIQGPATNMDAVNGNLLTALQFPRVPDILVPFSYLTVRAGATSTGFTPGVTNWNATGITTAVKDVVSLPSRPVFP